MDKAVELLKTTRTIAVVGISANPEKPSYRVAEYLRNKGYAIYPVNPNYESVLGQKCYPNLASVPAAIDIVDVFRRPEDVMRVAEEAIHLNIKCFWMQLGIRSAAARKLLEEKNVLVIDDTCLKIFHADHEKELA